MIKTTGKQKNYELIEYVNDVNREYVEVLMELNINGIMDTAYSYGSERLTNERFTGWTGYYTYDIRGSVSGVTDSEGMLRQSYRYDGFGTITFGKPQYNNVYSYNAESYNPNVDAQYLRARYYSPKTADFLTEDSYLGNTADPLTLNRYNYVKSSPLNYVDPSGHDVSEVWENIKSNVYQETGKFIKKYLGEQGRLKIAEIGTGEDRLEIFIQIADENGEVDLCEAVNDVVSLVAGMGVENSNYWNRSFSPKLKEIGGILNTLKDIAWLFGYSDDLETFEEEIVYHYFDPDMYYTGKYLADIVEGIIASKEAAGLESLIRVLSNDLDDWTFSKGKRWVRLWTVIGTAAIGAAGGLGATYTGATVGGAALGSAAGAAVGEAFGAGTVIIIGLGESVAINGAQILLMEAQSTVNRSQKNAEKNKEKIEGENDSKLKWGNPKSKPTYGHTFSQHGQKQTSTQLTDRARNLGHQVGQWLDDQKAADFLADVAKKGEGVYDVELPTGIKGRSFLPDGTEVTIDMARVIVKSDGSIRTAFPYNSLFD